MAGIFGLFDYTKPGPGVSKNTPPLKGLPLFFSIFSNNFWKLVKLNMLFLLFCVPLITIPAAVSGMTRVLRDMVMEKPIFIWTDFWSAFKSNFFQSFCYGLIVSAFSFIMYAVLTFYVDASPSLLIYTGELIVLTSSVIFILMCFYVPLMVVTVNLKLSEILNNAFRLSIIVFFRNVITFFIVLVLVTIHVLFFPITVLPMLFISFSAIGLIICFSAFPVIKKYVVIENPATNDVQPIFKD